MTHEAKTVEVTTPGDNQVVVKRKFDAPLSLVWRCYTEPELVKRWLLGPPGWSMPVCEMDLRPGGKYRYRWRNDADGSEFGFVGTFKDIETEKRITHTETPEDAPEMGESFNEIEFNALGDMSELVMTMTYENAEVRESVLATGMTDGMGMSFEMLDKLLVEQQI